MLTEKELSHRRIARRQQAAAEYAKWAMEARMNYLVCGHPYYANVANRNAEEARAWSALARAFMKVESC